MVDVGAKETAEQKKRQSKRNGRQAKGMTGTAYKNDQ